jgi:hypothetical protein
MTPAARALAPGAGPRVITAAPRPARRAPAHLRGPCRAEPSDDSSPPPADTDTSAAPPAPRRPAPPPGLRLERVERLGDEAWSGVARVDRGGGAEPGALARVALLAAGDAAALLAFAAVGRASHGEALAPGALLATAGPFLVGWFAAAVATGAFGPAARGGAVGPALGAAARAWAAGVPAALALRALSRGYLPDTSFVIVSFVATGVLLLGWRGALAAATPAAEPGAARRNRSGGPLEFLSLLASLTKRW